MDKLSLRYLIADSAALSPSGGDVGRRLVDIVSSSHPSLNILHPVRGSTDRDDGARPRHHGHSQTGRYPLRRPPGKTRPSEEYRIADSACGLIGTSKHGSPCKWPCHFPYRRDVVFEKLNFGRKHAREGMIVVVELFEVPVADEERELGPPNLKLEA